MYDERVVASSAATTARTARSAQYSIEPLKVLRTGLYSVDTSFANDHASRATAPRKLGESSSAGAATPAANRRATTPESARKVTARRASERLGSEMSPPSSERKTHAHSSFRPAKKGTRPPYCSSTAKARHDATVVKEEKIWKTGR